MIGSQREAIILDLLSQHGVVTVEEMATHCNCSAMSVRRDLRRLEDRGLIKRTHGGATVPDARLQPPPPHSESVLQARAALVDRADALIVTPVKTATLELLVSRARRAGIPVIAESVLYPGASTSVSIDDFGAGVALGRWVGAELRKQGPGEVIVLDVTCTLSNTTARSNGFADGLRDLLGKRHTVIRVDGQGLRREAGQVVADALAANPGIHVVFAVNDDSALGALDAWQAAGRPEGDLLLVSFGLEGQRTKDLLCAGGPYKAAVAMFPEIVGRVCIDAAVCAYHDCALPERLITPYAIMTPGTLEDYYERDGDAGPWKIRPAAQQQLLASSIGTVLLDECHDSRRPARLGYVQVFSSHDWYQNVSRAMQERCQGLGIRLEVIDSSHDLDAELEHVNRIVGRVAARFIEDGDTIILDAGPVTAHLAASLRGRKNLTVITNSLDAMNQLRDEPGIRLMVSGGLYRSENRCLVGQAAEETFRGLRVSKAFLTCTGVSLNFGLSTNSTSEAGIKRIMLEAGREIILLANHTVIGTEALIQIAPVGNIHRLITDPGISDHDRVALTQRGLEVIIAEENGKEVIGKQAIIA